MYGFNSYGGMPSMNGYVTQMPSNSMWWKPSDDKEKKSFEGYKLDVKTFLTICKEGIPVRKAYSLMAEQMETEIRYQDIGFKNFGEFLFHCQDILDVRTDYANGYYLFLRGYADEATEHLRMLVQGQSNVKSKRFVARLSNTRSCQPNVLLQLLTRPNHLMALPPPRPTGYRGGNRGGRRGGGRGGFRGGSAFNSRPPRLNPLLSSVPTLKPYQPDKTVRPGLLRSVVDNLTFDDDSDDDDMDDWYWSSTTDLKPADGMFSDGEDMVDSKNGMKTPEEIPMETTPKPIAQAVRTNPTTTSALSNSIVNTKPVVKAPINIIASGEIKQDGISTATPARRPNPFKPSATVASTSTASIPKLVPYVPKPKLETPSDKGVISQPDIPPAIAIQKSAPVLPSVPSAAFVTTSSEQAVEKPVNQWGSPASTSIATQPVGTLNLEKVKEHSTISAESANTTDLKPKPLSSILKAQSTNFGHSKPVASYNPFVTNSPVATKDNFIIHVSSTSATRTVELSPSSEPILTKPMIIYKEKPFNAKLVGADGFGFLFLQLDEVNINKRFVKLQQDLNEFYSSERIRYEFRYCPQEIWIGQTVAAKINNNFCRSRVYDLDKAHCFCVVVDLDEHDFRTVPLKDVYRLDNQFWSPVPRAIMVKLSDISDDYMLTDEVADAFEVTPLYPPNVVVKFVRQNEVFNVPEVFMVLESTGKDVASLLQHYGTQFFKLLSDDERIVRSEARMRLRKDLVNKKYLLVQ